MLVGSVVYLPGTLIRAVHLSQAYSSVDVGLSEGGECYHTYIDILSRSEGVDYYNAFGRTFGPAQPSKTNYIDNYRYMPSTSSW